MFAGGSRELPIGFKREWEPLPVAHTTVILTTWEAEIAWRLVQIAFMVFVCFGLFETRFYCVAQAGLELPILLPQPPEQWNYKHEPPFLPYFYFYIASRIIIVVEKRLCQYNFIVYIENLLTLLHMLLKLNAEPATDGSCL
jgi:hypothetical protein